MIARGRRRWGAVLAALALAMFAPPASAGSPDGAAALSARVAVLGIDALGIDEERVARLEALFRNELERLAGMPLPTRRQVEQALGSSAPQSCSADPHCLGALGKKLGVASFFSARR